MDKGFSYSARSANVGRRRLWIATFVVVALFAIDLITGGAVRAVVADFSTATEKVERGIFSSDFFSSKASLAQENQSLKEKVATLEEQAALSTALQQQVTALQGIAHLAGSSAGVTAPVASSFIASPYGTFLIGAGSDEGVTSGALVLFDDVDDTSADSDHGVVVGIVSEVSARTATVSEIFAPNHSVNALLDGAAIPVMGKGGGNAIAQVPNGVNVSLGDPITAPEYGGRTIGIVGNVDSDPSNAAMQVTIGLPVNLSSMQYVFIPSAQ
jgi:cell shape-determining protein MreC